MRSCFQSFYKLKNILGHFIHGNVVACYLSIERPLGISQDQVYSFYFLLQMITTLLLSLLLPLLATTIEHVAANDEDTVSSGNYQIQNCNSHKAESDASYLQQLLPQIRTNLRAVIADARLGTASKHGYGTFFKTNDNIEDVITVYRRIAAGNDVLVRSVSDSNILGLTAARPTIVCVNNVLETAPIYQACLRDWFDPTSVHVVDSNLIALCPQFWERKEAPLPRVDCPRSKASSFILNNLDLISNQQAMIVYKLAHLYEDVSVSGEVMNNQNAADLNSTSPVQTATNYAFYYAGEQRTSHTQPELE